MIYVWRHLHQKQRNFKKGKEKINKRWGKNIKETRIEGKQQKDGITLRILSKTKNGK